MGQKQTNLYSLLGKLILIAVTAELVILGGGRFVEFGSITLRMIFFLLAQTYVILAVLNKDVRPPVTIIVIYFIFSLIFSALIGVYNNANVDLIVSDIKT